MLTKELLNVEAKPYKIPHPFRKLNKELIDILVKDIAEGSTQRLAAESNGITEAIFYIWQQQGKIDIQHEVDSLCGYLVKSLGRVKKEEVKWARQTIKETERGHKGAEWTLEHAYWRDFSAGAPNLEMAEEIRELQEKQGGVPNVEANDQEKK